MKKLVLVFCIIGGAALADEPQPPPTLVMPTHLMNQIAQLLSVDGGAMALGLIAQIQGCASLQATSGVIIGRGQCPIVKTRLDEIAAQQAAKAP